MATGMATVSVTAIVLDEEAEEGMAAATGTGKGRGKDVTDGRRDPVPFELSSAMAFSCLDASEGSEGGRGEEEKEGDDEREGRDTSLGEEAFEREADWVSGAVDVVVAWVAWVAVEDEGDAGRGEDDIAWRLRLPLLTLPRMR